MSGMQAGMDAVEAVEPVRKSLRVRVGQARAFEVFTREIDAWWPRTHHVGASPLARVVLEPRTGGSVSSEQEDGTSIVWGKVTTWEPPQRFVMAWMITPDWKLENDLERCSEVEVTFTPADDGTTLVELEHRNFERHGGAFGDMRKQVGSEGGWGALLGMFAEKAGGAA